MKLLVKFDAEYSELPRPAYQTAGAAGMDLLACIPEGKVIHVYPGCRALIPCGFSMALEEGYEAQVRPRSGLALKNGITVLNSPGTIDSDYRGPVCVILYNTSDVGFPVTRGMRIAQMVIAPVVQPEMEAVDVLPETVRGQGGFGSTGVE